MQQNDNQAESMLSLEEQNHLLLKETLKMVRKMHRIYLTQTILTIVFIVLPVIGTAVFLPAIIRNFASALSQLNPQGGQVDAFLNTIEGKK